MNDVPSDCVVVQSCFLTDVQQIRNEMRVDLRMECYTRILDIMRAAARLGIVRITLVLNFGSVWKTLLQQDLETSGFEVEWSDDGNLSIGWLASRTF